VLAVTASGAGSEQNYSLVAAMARGIFSSGGKDAAAARRRQGFVAFEQPRKDATTSSRYTPRLETVQAGHLFRLD